MDKKPIAKVMSEMGKRSAKKLTKKQRSERARKAANARWKTGDNSPRQANGKNIH